jgi:hypothetical protein
VAAAGADATLVTPKAWAVITSATASNNGGSTLAVRYCGTEIQPESRFSGIPAFR